MTLKVFKAIWFLSLIIFLGVFMYNYASLPETVVVIEAETPISLSRDVLFYSFLVMAAILNLFVFLINKLFANHIEFRAWFYGLITSLTIFLIVGINFIALYNSSEKFNYQDIGLIIYGSIALVVVWVLSWPIYKVAKRLFFK